MAWFALPASMIIISIGFAIADRHVAAETPTFIEETEAAEEIPTETAEPLKRAKIEVTEASNDSNALERVERVEMTVSEKIQETEPATTEPWIEPAPIYSYKNREYLDEGIQGYVWELWQMFHMPTDWYRYAIGLIYQECAFNIHSVHVNGDGSKDIGYFQYNTRWWAGSAAKYGRPNADINNPYDQAWLFVSQFHDRKSRGMSLEQCLSCHRRGEYDGYDAEYVRMVTDRTNALTRIK